ncbi:MAG TPA: outer membrane lipoprotein-sorting protein [Candidatus Binatia bacterium]|nr:outer membrane lipoprotein-sorting protein [Candidatus Binatia bacterium]
MRTCRLALILVPLLAAPAHAAPLPDAATIVAKMKAALEPPKASVRQLKLSISGEDGGTTQWTLAQARKTLNGQGRMLMVVLAPQSDRGITGLIIDGKGGQPAETALWIPVIRRVRTLTPAGAYESVLGSDFMYADLGFVNLKDKWTFVGPEKHDGKDSYKLEQKPHSPWYYSKIVAWVDPATMLPLERDYYDPAGQLWKVETFQDVMVIDGQPVATRVRMQDKQTGGASELVTSNLRFGVDLPDTLFERGSLPTAVEAPVWAGLQ